MIPERQIKKSAQPRQIPFTVLSLFFHLFIFMPNQHNFQIRDSPFESEPLMLWYLFFWSVAVELGAHVWFPEIR